MALLCYRKGCGQRFDPERNAQDACLYHPGLPVFHDALKGWSCCKKRTTDFSDFLSIKGCTKGCHSHEKPPPEEASAESPAKTCPEAVAQGPKSKEVMQRQRPSPDEPKQLLVVKVSQALQNILEKLEAGPRPHGPGDAQELIAGATCKNSGCQAVYRGEESSLETCTFHPGVPIFHEGLKSWSCCGIKTTNFAAFLEQMGCRRGRHTWGEKQQDGQRVSCRQDWHQTGSQVVVTIYAKAPLVHLTSVKANRTALDIHVAFEGGKIFQAELELWGVISTEKSFTSLLPSKVEITLRKESPVSWARLERRQSQGPALQTPTEPATTTGTAPGGQHPFEDSDDSLSWSEEEWEEDQGESQAGAPEIHQQE